MNLIESSGDIFHTKQRITTLEEFANTHYKNSDALSAVKYFKRLNPQFKGTKYGKLTGRMLTDETFWFYRDLKRVCEAGGKLVPLYGQKGFKNIEHMPILRSYECSDSQPFVFYYSSHEKAIRDVREKIKVGRYLRKTTDWRDEEIASHTQDLKLAVLNGFHKLYFARTAEEIEHVYVSGPHTCMSYPAGDSRYTYMGIHPSAVYESPDVGIAYIKKNDKIKARSVVNFNSRQFGRIYGDSKSLSRALENVGYRYNLGCLFGARLKKMVLNEGSRTRVVMPYLDGGPLLVAHSKNYLFMASPPDARHYRMYHHCTSTTGSINLSDVTNKVEDNHGKV